MKTLLGIPRTAQRKVLKFITFAINQASSNGNNIVPTFQQCRKQKKTFLIFSFSESVKQPEIVFEFTDKGLPRKIQFKLEPKSYSFDTQNHKIGIS